METDLSDNESLQENITFQKQDCHASVTTTSNWNIGNNKCFDDCISTVSLLQVPESTNLDDVVSLDTCIALTPDESGESCRLEFKLKNQQRIARIAVVSEASVLEFFKQSGEYANTVFAEFVDDFQNHAVYFAEAKIQPPSTEAGIKFTRTKNKGTTMWIYGIKLILTETKHETTKNTFDFDVINNFLSNTDQSNVTRIDMAKKVFESFADSDDCDSSSNDVLANYIKQFGRFLKPNQNKEVNQLSSLNKKLECNGSSVEHNELEELKLYIDSKFITLEKRLMERIEVMDKKSNQKLDAILQKIESIVLRD